MQLHDGIKWREREVCDDNGDIDLLNDRAILSLDGKSVFIMKKEETKRGRVAVAASSVIKMIEKTGGENCEFSEGGFVRRLSKIHVPTLGSTLAPFMVWMSSPRLFLSPFIFQFPPTKNFLLMIAVRGFCGFS